MNYEKNNYETPITILQHFIRLYGTEHRSKYQYEIINIHQSSAFKNLH